MCGSVDSTPGECARARETAHRSDLAGWAEYGYYASHSRFFWGPRLHLVCTLHGLPVGWALTGAKADERETFVTILDGPLPYDDQVLRQRCLQQLPDDRTFVVAVECSAEELRRRESSRAEPRPREWASGKALNINDDLRLVVTIDSALTVAPPITCDVLAALDQASSR